jgi:hypothetical protein
MLYFLNYLWCRHDDCFVFFQHVLGIFSDGQSGFIACSDIYNFRFFSIPALRNNRKAFVSFIPKTLVERICKSEKITLGSDHK